MKLKVICNCISIYSANYCLPSLHNSLEWRDKTHHWPWIDWLCRLPLLPSTYHCFLASKNLHQPVVLVPFCPSFSVQVLCFCSQKCLVSLFFYSSTTVVCILISTIPRKWVRLGFNCLFLVYMFFVSVSSSVFYFCVFRHLLSVWITLLLNQDSRFVGFGCPVSHFRKIFPSICSVSRCNVWLAYTAYCYGILFSCLFFSSSNFNIIFFTRYVQIQFPILLGYLLPLMGICKFVCDFFQID